MEFKWRTTGFPIRDNSKYAKKYLKDCSVRVLVIESGEERFAVYMYGSKIWSVDGRMGMIEVTHWSYIPKHK